MNRRHTHRHTHTQKNSLASLIMGVIGLHFKSCYNNGSEKKREQHHISVLKLVRGKCPGICAVTRSNETHDVHFHLKYHIHNHNYSHYSISAGGFFTATLNMTTMHVTIITAPIITGK